MKVETGIHHGSIHAKIPKLPVFNEDKDDLDAYLGRFEQYARVQKWPGTTWATNLSALLTGKALETYSRLHPDNVENYDALKEALLMRFQLTEDGFRERFYKSTAEDGETAGQFVTRLQRYLERWMDLSETPRSYEGLRDLLVREHFISACHEELATFMREKRLKYLKEVTIAADNYVQAHKGNLSLLKPSKKISTRTTQGESQQMKRNPTCHRCGKLGHIAPRCRTFLSSGKEVPKEAPNDSRKCFVCGKSGHIARNCRVIQKPPHGTAMALEEATMDSQCSQPQNSTPQECSNPAPECQLQEVYASCPCKPKACPCHADHPTCFATSIGDVNESYDQMFTSSGGQKYPVCTCDTPAPGCYCNNLPTSPGYIGKNLVHVMRDSGCTGVVVKKNYVGRNQYTGKYRLCLLVDGTVRKVPVALITIDSPYYSGNVEAMVMDTPVYDIILGNIPGVRDVGKPDPNWTPDVKKGEADETLCPVVTRQQKKAKSPKPLRVPDPDIQPTKKQEDFIKEQKEDNTLEGIWKKAYDTNASPKQTKTAEISFEVRTGMLYRIYKRFRGTARVTLKQVLLPKQRRLQCMRLAHEAILGGHMGVQKTIDRITSNFYWPGLQGDVSRFCKSCDICQRTLPKGKVPKAPLDDMPLVDVPFKRVAVDIIGPIHPMSEKGKRWILTLVDHATRYPEAIALSSIDTQTVAESLLDIFSRVGFPEEILSDNGSQFTSDMMREVTRLISLKQLTTSPYHPMCNGLVEKYNGTLKLVLKRLCEERPKDWDRYLPAVLFSYREVPQESTRFSPFELLYGRNVRGPMDILRNLWTKEQDKEHEAVTNVYHYVLDLQNRIEETCKLARMELMKANQRYKKYYNQRTRHRQLKPGDTVLILLPTDQNKLLLQWKGPFKVLNRIAKYDYSIDVNGKSRTFHINMLKEYIQRKSEDQD